MPLLSWLLCMACLTGAAMLLAQGMRAGAAGRTIMRRFRRHVSPRQTAPWAGTRLYALMEALSPRLADTQSLQGLRQTMIQAGYTWSGAPFLFVTLRFVAALGAAALPLLPSLAHHAAPKPGKAAAALFFGFAAYQGAFILLKLRLEHRQRQLRRELPHVLDLLLMVLDSGITADQALQHAGGQIAHIAPIMAGLLARYAADTADGVPYDKALDRLAQRAGVSEVRDFVGLLKQNLIQGGELTQPLHRLSADIGESRLAHAREQMGRKSVLLTLAMLTFFMPVLFIALAGPAVSDLMGTLGDVAHKFQTRNVRP